MLCKTAIVVAPGSWERPPILQSRQEVTKDHVSQSGLERPPIEGDRPVDESVISSVVIPSSASPVEPGVNLGGPPPKAKYSSATGSGLVA